MLDRKIKDRNASVELLIDRIEQSKKLQGIICLVVVGMLLWAGLFYILTGTVGMPMIILFGANCGFIAFCTISIFQSNTSLLLYFKEREQKNDVKGDKV